MCKVAAYARVSSDKEDQINSFENQVRYFTNQINKEQNWQLVNVYCDEGITGTTTSIRSGFKRMIRDALLGKIDLIITKEVSRFARNIEDAIRYTRILKEHNVYVRFILDGIDTRDPDSELKLAIFSALAQEESRKTSERVKWGQSRQMERGVVFGGNLLGYRVEHGVLHLIPEDTELVRLIFHKYLNEGKGSFTIAKELNELGARPYDTQRPFCSWSSTAILRVLRNEKYVGDLCQKKTYTKSYLDHKKRYNRGEEPQIYIRDHHPEIAIISRAVWNATQAELMRRAASAARRHSTRYWSSGKIYCGFCGGKFVNKVKYSGSEASSGCWRCSNHIKPKHARKMECTLSEGLDTRSLNRITGQLLRILTGNTRQFLNSEFSQKLRPFAEERLSAVFSALSGADEVYAEIVTQITVYENHTLLIKLKNIAVGFLVMYKSSGRAANYTTEILSIHRTSVD